MQPSNNFKTFIALIQMILFLFNTSTIQAERQTPIAQVQGMYLYNFAKYVKWSNIESELKVGVYATSEEFAAIKAALASRKVGNSLIVVQRLTKAEQAVGMHMIFSSKSNNSIFKRIRESGKTKNMLLVTDGDQISKGASISFVIVSSKLRYKINKETCNKDGLSVSNNLISLGV